MRYFIDCEFYERGGVHPIQLISVGIVAEDGREYYAQRLPVVIEVSDWVARFVYPQLGHFDMGVQDRSCGGHIGTSRTSSTGCPWRWFHELRQEITAFCDPAAHGPPEFWTYYGAYDWVVFTQLFGTMSDLPEGWPMFAYDVRQWLNHKGLTDVCQPEDAPHNALSDARWVAETYGTFKDASVGIGTP